MESEWTSDKGLSRIETTEGNPSARDRKSTRSHIAQEGLRDQGVRMSEHRRRERRKIRDNLDPLSCPPIEEGKSIFWRN